MTLAPEPHFFWALRRISANPTMSSDGWLPDRATPDPIRPPPPPRIPRRQRHQRCRTPGLPRTRRRPPAHRLVRRRVARRTDRPLPRDEDPDVLPGRCRVRLAQAVPVLGSGELLVRDPAEG